MITKYGSELVVGDVIRTIGHDCPIISLRPYANLHLFDFMDERWRVAELGGWGRTIDPDLLWAQLGNGVWIDAGKYPDQDISFGKPLVREPPA